jgi:pimeloyl-ACP methyl ester carboxylesterase
VRSTARPDAAGRPAAKAARLAAVVAAVVTGGLLAGCAVGPSQRPAVAVRDAPLPPAPRPTTTATSVPLPPLRPSGTDTIDFRDCTTQTRNQLGAAATRELEYECGTVTVDLNPDEPRRRAGIGDIQVLRTGSGPTPLVVVGDVAGEPGTLLAARLANEAPPELLSTFRLVGVDRRGTGGSEPVRCVPGDARGRLIAIDPGGVQPAAGQAVLEAATEAVRTCVQQIEDMLPLIDSWRTAGDLEQLRRALGAERLNAVAVGDGSRVVSAYLSRFTATVGRVVLDGAPDPTLDAIGAGQDLAAAAEHAFDGFAADCAAAGCPLAPDPRQALLDAAAGLRAHPERAADGTTVGAGTLFSAVLAGLADQSQWPALATAIADASRGEVDAAARLVRPWLDSGTTEPPRLDAALLTTCNDTTTRVPPERVGQLSEEWRARAALFGPLFAQRLLTCSSAPVPGRTVPAPRSASTPPVLVLGTDGDPLTPLAGTQRMAEALAAGLLVTWQGYGHGAFPRTPCVTGAVQAFLVSGTQPRSGTVCPP